jgi:hypothetical protein
MEKRITFYPPQTWRGRFLGTILTLVALLLGATQAEAQTVHIALDNGSLLTGVGPGNDSGWEPGFSTAWRHEQLSLTMMGSDRDELKPSGEEAYPSNVYAKHSVVSGDNKDKQICIIGGRRPSFMVVSLPKGYRITSYTIVLANDLRGANFGGNFNNLNTNREILNGNTRIMRFYETKPWAKDQTNSGTTGRSNGEGYDETQVRYIEPGTDWQNGQIGTAATDILAQAKDDNGNGDITPTAANDTEYKITRTAHVTGEVDENGQPIYDMGNQLYFRLVKNYFFYGITIKEFRIEFTAEGTFAADVVPDAVGEATSCVASPFKTSKIDFGRMQERGKQGTNTTHYAFAYEQINDLQAYNYLYQDDAIENGAPADVATQKNIRPVEVDGQMLYALKSDTYFLEPPIEIATSGGNAPIGYRIVGALFTPLWGTETDEFKPGSYKLKIYKRDGSGLMRWKYDDESGYLQTDDESKPDYIEISAENDTDLGKVIDIGLFNNDAVKFEIETTGDTQALVQITLLLQALDPYIDKMDIVCTANDNVLHLTQSFTADDFSVSGGKFIFYVPEDYYDKELTFTFSDLYSKYGDETYYGGGSGFGRYSFVTSPYFVKVDGNGDTGLYNNTNYSPNALYNDKVYTSTAGNIRFKFNNAEDLAGETQAGNLVETPFSVAYYLTTTDPGDPIAGTAANSSKGAEFIPVKLKASNVDQRSGIFFVFTADETRWNIAQTTAWQHRYYAFYRMEIEAVAKTFTPAFTPIKIYDKTLYTKDGTKKEDSMWGLIVDVADTENGHKVQGYLTYQEIINAIQYGREATYWKQGDDIPAGKNVGDEKTPYVAPVLKDAAHSADGPTSMEQILYVDGTPLYAMLNSAEDQDVITVEDLREKLAMNSLVFLPENTTSTFDNTAFETSTGFVAGKDIKLTDKQPFFTPYDIQVASANTTTYTRMISADENGQADYATIIVPFALTVDDNGIHTNPDGSQFSVNVMYNGQQMKLQPGSAVDHGTAFFKPLKNAGATSANTPYMVSIMSRGTLKDGENFVVEQNGASIAATPTNGAANEFGTGWMHKGSSATATFDEKEYNFTNVATFSGAIFDRALSENVFYFAAGKYLDLHTLAKSAGRYLYVYPFRNVFTYPDNGAWVTQPSTAKALKWFDISFDEPNYNGVVTEVDNIANADLMVKVGKGVVTLSATRSQDVNISTLSGMNMKRVALDAGNTQNVVLPAGIYLINNVKVIVK